MLNLFNRNVVGIESPGQPFVCRWKSHADAITRLQERANAIYVIAGLLGISSRDGENRSCLVAKGRVIRPSQSWFNADFVVHSEPELLFTAEVMFRCLDGYVTEEELNLVELAARQMAKTRTCPSQIVRRQFVYAGSVGRSLDDLPKPR